MKTALQPTRTEFSIFNRRIAFYNDVLGGLCVALAFSVMGTEAPRFYGILSMLFVLLMMHHHDSRYQRVYSLWREIEHPFVKGTFALRRGKVFTIGFLFLCLVSAGALTKHGVFGFGF